MWGVRAERIAWHHAAHQAASAGGRVQTKKHGAVTTHRFASRIVQHFCIFLKIILRLYFWGTASEINCQAFEEVPASY